MKTNVAILMPTCDRYLPIARLSASWLDIYWPSHPPVLVCGCSADAHLGQYLPLEADPRNWLAIAAGAVERTLAAGFTHAYLLLDDHPPLINCSAEFLNRTLPELAAQLNAVKIDLVGWDQFVTTDGEIERYGACRLMRNRSGFPWRFSLHPGLWELATLGALLRRLLADPAAPASARAFESRAARESGATEPDWNARTFRIEGDRHAQPEGWYMHTVARRAARTVIHARRWCASRLRDAESLAALDARMAWYTKFFNGPYPIYWSGLVAKGVVNANCAEFLKRIGRTAQRREMKKAIAGMSPAGA